MKKQLNRMMTVLLIGACASAYGYDNPIEGGTTEYVSDTWTVPLPWLMVGSNSKSNTLFIWNGGRVESQVGIIGNAIGSEDNSAFVSGSGTLWNSGVEIAVGNLGGDNTLGIFSGGRVETPSLYVGKSSSSNFVAISGEGSIVNASALHVGHTGADNGMGIMDGGRASSGNASIGYWVGSAGNSALVMGTNTVWNNTGTLNVGEHGSGNMLMVVDGGRVQSPVINVGVKSYSSNNTISVWGENAVLTSSELNIGGTATAAGGTGNRVSVYDGGRIETTDITIHTGNDLDLNNGGTFAINNDFDAAMSGFNFNSGGTLEVGGNLAGMSSSIEGARGLILNGTNAVWNKTGSAVAIGGNSSGNTLVITNGATVMMRELGIAKTSSASGNSLIVSGEGSKLMTQGSGSSGLVISRGDNNYIEVSDGAVSDIQGGIGYAILGYYAGSDNNTMLVDNGTVNLKQHMYVGLSGSDNRLIITNGGVVSAEGSFIGRENVSNGNTAYISGVGSALNVQKGINVGAEGSNNRLMISQGGTASAVLGYIGRFSTADNNALVINGTGSKLIIADEFYVGKEGAGNSFTVVDGGVGRNHIGYIGYDSDADNNMVTVSGSGSMWNNSSDLYIGYEGSDNTLSIEDGGQVVSSGGTIGYGIGADSNTVLVSGADSLWDAKSFRPGSLDWRDIAYASSIDEPLERRPFPQPKLFTVGHQGSGNFLSITDGGRVESSDSYIGYEEMATGNSVLVSGVGSIWSSGILNVGYNGAENSLRIEDGGRVDSLRGVIGFGVSADSNRVLVSGAGSEWNVGFQPIIIDDPWPPYTTFSASADLGSLANELVVPVDPKFFIEPLNILIVGQNGSRNLLEIENGGFVESFNGIIGRNSNAWNNVVLVSGVGSEWSNKHDLSLGGYNALYVTGEFAEVGTEHSEWRAGGRGNSLYIGDGGLVSVGRDMHNRNYSGIAIDPGGHISVASNYYQDATSSIRFGVETNAAGAPLNALVSVGGTAEFEKGATIEVASNVGQLKFDRVYTNKLFEANQLIVGGITNANSLDLELLDASGTLVDLLFWEHNQDIYGLVGRRYLADSAGFDTNSMMGRLSKEIDDLSLLGNTNANNMINILNGMSGDQQNAQLTQLYTQSAPVYMHNRAMHGAQKQVMEHTRSFRLVRRPTVDMAATNTTNVVVGAAQDEHSLRGWMQGFGSWADHGESGSSTGFDQSLYGTIVGMDKTFGNLMIGAAGGYARSYLNQDNFDSSDAWTRFGILYAAFAGEKWFGDVTLSYGRSRIQTRSGTVFGAEGKSDADHYAVYVGGGRDIHLSDSGIIFTPEAALYVDYFDQESYSDGYRDVDAYDRWSYQSRLGAALAVQKQVGSVLLKPDVHAYWLHEFNSDTDQVSYSLTGGTGRYVFGMQAPDADILEVGVGIAAALTDRLELMLSVDGQHSDRTEAVRATGRISFRF